MRIIALYNIKGGVGKTTNTVNLACMLAKQGKTVLLWDMDPQGGSSYFFNVENKNDNTHARLLDNYCSIYEVIQPTQNNRIDIIGNDSKFTDQFMYKASKITALNFANSDLIKTVLSNVEDDYDICLIDCAPGRFLLHDNIFKAIDLLLIPNIPAPLSVYCNDMLLDELQSKINDKNKILCFYNMVQAHKTVHKHYLNEGQENYHMLNSYIPFYAEIEAITMSKESIFQHLKEFKTNIYYERLWQEICLHMRWHDLSNTKSVVVDINSDQEKRSSVVINLPQTNALSQTVNAK
ncbi:MAG: AAA family ATPase [Chitinophagaceae bacterium]